jgi:hypothetical protein
MTTSGTLFACSAADVTLGRIRELVAGGALESLTLEFKEAWSSNITKTIAGMANSYGGLILVGVEEQTTGERVVGAPAKTLEQIANSCQNSLEPPWAPEIISVPLPDNNDRYVFVIRVHTNKAPRPILMGGAAPVRDHGRTAKAADRARLAQLFRESEQNNIGVRRTLPALELAPDGANSGQGPDFGLRSGLIIPISETASWRPLSERAVKRLTDALNHSAVSSALTEVSKDLGGDDFGPFGLHGFNRSRNANLVWRCLKDGHDLASAVASLTIPNSYGAPGSGLTFTLDITLRPNAFKKSAGVSPDWLLNVEVLHSLLSTILKTLVSDDVTNAVASVADIDPILVPQPTSCDFRTRVGVRSLLDISRLSSIDGSGVSRGAELIGNPLLDLRETDRRREQVDIWMQQIALDAGLAGMEELLPSLADR